MNPTQRESVLAGLPGPVELVSLRRARQLFAAAGLTITPDMSNRLADAGVLGREYRQDYEAGSANADRKQNRMFAADRIHELAAQPVVDLGDKTWRDVMDGCDLVLILRMLPAGGFEHRFSTDDREFRGAHQDLVDSTDPAARATSDDALRMYWKVSPTRRAQMLQRIADHRPVRLVVTVAKRVLAGRDITGLDSARMAPDVEQAHRVAMTVTPAGDWFAPLRNTWLQSGQGPSTIWWNP